LAIRDRVWALFSVNEFVRDGGAMSYGMHLQNLSRRSAIYVDKIFRGSRPADVLVEQPTKFELVINLKTAKALGPDDPAVAAGAGG
jgi:putative ABC transport system substrate-binding protein